MRPLFAVLIALAMLFAPFAMQTGSAHAAMPSDHHARTVEATHCGGEQGKVDQSVDHSCCAAMCSGVALTAALSPEFPAFKDGDDQPGTERFGRSHLAKLPTPPPRIA